MDTRGIALVSFRATSTTLAFDIRKTADIPMEANRRFLFVGLGLSLFGSLLSLDEDKCLTNIDRESIVIRVVWL